jgi:LAO/AO transport system kinase
MDIVEGVLSGNVRAIARAITLAENEAEESEKIIDKLHRHTGRGILFGVTGPPGSGKSTLIDRMVEKERRKSRKVAVIAVDPSSQFSGGAILGDRVRMLGHAADPGVFIRSMASRGHLGGVAVATGDAIKILDAAGYDTIIIESIGVGQTEVEIVKCSDIVILVLVPGTGDDIQAMKAGIMEIGDIFVVNKKDLDGAEKLKVEIESTLGLPATCDPEKNNHVVMISAKNDEGIDYLLESAYSFFNKMSEEGLLVQKRKDRIARELKNIISKKINNYLDVKIDFSRNLEGWAESIYNKEIDPYSLINHKMNDILDRDVLKEKEQINDFKT